MSHYQPPIPWVQLALLALPLLLFVWWVEKRVGEWWERRRK